MAYFPDLSSYTYTRTDGASKTLNVGFLERGRAFPTGPTPEGFVGRLFDLCLSPSTIHRGFHECEFCRASARGPLRARRGDREAPLGFGLIRVPGRRGTTYVAPNLIYHYVVDHGYQPPDEFVRAVMGEQATTKAGVPGSFDLPRLRDGLKPFRLHWFPRLGSTNTHAAVLRDRGTLFAPAVVLTGRQLAGRGRGVHRWWSPAGCLTVTFVLPTDPAVEPHQVPLLAGLAVRRAAARLLDRAAAATNGEGASTVGHLRSHDRQGVVASSGSMLAYGPAAEESTQSILGKAAQRTASSRRTPASPPRLPPSQPRASRNATPPLPYGRGSLNASPSTTPRTPTTISRSPAAAAPPSAGVRLKWPNDVQHDGRKLAGLLCERALKVDLVGVGLNVNVDPADAPPDLRPTLTSLAAVAGRPFDMTDALLAVAAELQQVMRERSQHPFGVLLKEYDEHHALIGRRVSVLGAGDGRAVDGKCEGLDEMGRLLVRDRQRLHHVIAGQVVAR